MNETTLGILIALTLPLLGTTVGSVFAFFLKKRNKRPAAKSLIRLCSRRYDCGIYLESLDARY